MDQIGARRREDPPALSVLAAETAQRWEAVYREHVVQIYRFVYSRTGNRADAEDVVARVFLQALPRLRTGVGAAEVRGYLHAVARTVIADHWRERYAVPVGELHDIAVPETPSADPEGTRADWVGRLLDRLPDRYRHVLELRFLQGMSAREAAREMGVTVGNLRVLQLRALRRAATLPSEAGDGD